ncbi:hypothetical protein LXL04_034127 [Taraxacum kok-saghyz]
MMRRRNPVRAHHYELYEEIGQGINASVFRASGSQTKVKVNVKLPGGKDDSGSSEVRDLKAELERLES